MNLRANASIPWSSLADTVTAAVGNRLATAAQVANLPHMAVTQLRETR